MEKSEVKHIAKRALAGESLVEIVAGLRREAKKRDGNDPNLSKRLREMADEIEAWLV